MKNIFDEWKIRYEAVLQSGKVGSKLFITMSVLDAISQDIILTWSITHITSTNLKNMSP